MRKFINIITESWAPDYVYHGSRVPVEKFEYREGSRFVLFSEFKVKSNGFYFALSPEDAKGYGDHVGIYRISVNKPLIFGKDIRNDTQRMGDLRYILEPLFAPSVDGEVFIHDGMIHVTEFTKEEFTDPNSNWPLSFVSHSSYGEGHGLDWEVLDNPHCVQRMRERGYDATTVYEPEHKDHRYSWFVLSPDQIEYVGQYEDDDYEEDDYEDDDLRENLTIKTFMNIVETYENTISGIRGKQTEIFRNPSRKEWKQCQGYEMVRGFIVENDLLIWPVYDSVHQMVRDSLKLPNTAIPVTIEGDYRGSIFITVTDNAKPPILHNPNIRSMILDCDFLKIFSDIEIGFFDESIEGDWEDLD